MGFLGDRALLLAFVQTLASLRLLRLIWSAVFWRINLGDLRLADQTWLLDEVVGSLSNYAEDLNGLTHFLFDASVFANRGSTEPHFLDKLISVSLVFCRVARTAPTNDDEDDISTIDWVSRAISSPAGRIVEFWLRFTEHRYKELQDPVKDWPSELKPSFDEISTASTPADWEGLALLSQHLAFCHAMTVQWTRERLYPLLDFELHGPTSWILWRALVLYGRLNRDLILELGTYFHKAFPFFARAEEKLLERFFAQIWTIIYSGLLDVTTTGWLRDFLRALTDKQRAAFAGELDRVIRGVSSEDMDRFWQRWMREYWRERLLGRPVPLIAEENGEMIAWVWMLPANDFREACELLQKGPAPKLQNVYLIDLTAGTRLAKEQPAAVLSLLVWLLSAAETYYDWKEKYLELLRQLPVEAGLLQSWENICNQLSRLGVASAAELLRAGRAHFSKTSGSTAD